MSGNISNMRYAVVDVETGGLSAVDSDIVSIAIITEDGREFYSLVRPLLPVEPEAAEVNGYNKEAWMGAPMFAEIADKVSSLLAGRVFVAHNAPFDVTFVQETARRQGILLPRIHAVCTKQLAMEKLNCKSFSLRSVTEHLRLPKYEEHNALADARACRNVFRQLWRKPRLLIALRRLLR